MAEQFNGVLVVDSDGSYLNITAGELYNAIMSKTIVFVCFREERAMKIDFLADNVLFNGKYSFNSSTGDGYSANSPDEFPERDD